MDVVTTATQFVAGCLTLGLGLFLLAGPLRDLSRLGSLPVISARAMTAVSGVALLAAGGFFAVLAIPL